MDYKEILNSDYFKESYTKIEELKKDFYVNHGFIHINNVISNAKYLADVFCLDSSQKDLLLVASALHDIGYLRGREDHAANGGVLACEYLKDKMCKEDVDLICDAIANHGGKRDDDYRCPISMCLILADKFDFTKDRYQDDGKEHTKLPLFLSIEKIILTRVDINNFILKIYTTNKQLFDNLEDSYYFKKLFEIFIKNYQKHLAFAVQKMYNGRILIPSARRKDTYSIVLYTISLKNARKFLIKA